MQLSAELKALTEHKAHKAIKLVSTFLGGVNGAVDEQFDKRTIRMEAYLQLNYVDKYLLEIEKILELQEKTSSDKKTEYVAALIVQMCYQMVLSGNSKTQNDALSMLYDIQHTAEVLPITNPLHYYMWMTHAINIMRKKDWEKLFEWARLEEVYAHYTYGFTSYQYGRAYILSNYAYVQVNGKHMNTDSIYKNFIPLPYRQGVPSGIDDENTIQYIAAENAFYDNLVKEINANIKKI